MLFRYRRKLTKISHLSENIQKAILYDKDEFVVKVSGHGSDYVYSDGKGNTSNPPKSDQWLSFMQAYCEADHWVGIACTIGGAAIVEHVPTRKTIIL